MSSPIPSLSQLSSTAQRQFDFNLEGLRGFAALVVVLGHAAYHRFSLDPAYTPSVNWASPFPGHSSVLIFFILSGYVIGLTNKNPITKQTILPYLRKRLVRLYPIYVITLIFTFIVTFKHYSFLVIAGHFLFLQNSAVPLIFDNNPLWSLNNEIIYYLAFIPLSYFGFAPGRVCIAAVVVGLICSFIIPFPLIGSYSFGFVFWTSGLWLAQSTDFSKQYSSRWFLAALMCLFLGYGNLNLFSSAISITAEKLHIHFLNVSGPNISFPDLAALPFCFYVFVVFTNHSIKRINIIPVATVASGFIYYAHIVHKYGLLSSQAKFLILPIIAFTIGSLIIMVLRIWPQPVAVVGLPQSLIKLGTISYAVYAIHFPVSIMLSHVNFFSGTGFTFVVRLLIDLILVLGIGYLLELKLQPWFKAKLSGPPIQRLAVAK